jgi:Ras association domain-containing protein 2/4
MNTPTRRPDIKASLKAYNEFYKGKPQQQITSKEVNGRHVLEGQLRISWGILHPIHFKQKDDGTPSPAPNAREPDFLRDLTFDDPAPSPRQLNGKPVDRTLTLPRGQCGDSDLSRYGSVVMRGDLKLKRVKKRLSILNGHIYQTETSMFVPAYGSVSSVTVSSKDTSPQVVRQLLDKFKVENGPELFCLVLVKCSGETVTLKEMDFPLIERIYHGPNEDDVKIFIMEKSRVLDINEQVAQYVNLSDAMLIGFLEKLKQDEELELSLIKERRRNYQQRIKEQMAKVKAGYL